MEPHEVHFWLNHPHFKEEEKRTMRNLDKFKSIAAEVSYWAKSNFGNTPVPFVGNTQCIGFGLCGHLPANAQEFRPVELDFIAPLMGMTEEVGEFSIANTEEDIKDALGDVAIYLCDFIGRVDLSLQRSNIEVFDWQLVAEYYGALETDEDLAGVEVYLPQAIGKLNHVCLKRFQRIRGYTDNDKFISELHRSVACIIRALDNAAWRLCNDDGCASSPCPADVILQKVWEGIVKKRDWNAERANEQAKSTN